MRQYQGASITKKESEWIDWFSKQSDNWWEAYLQYPARRAGKRAVPGFEKRSKAWFNKVLAGLKAKGLFEWVQPVWISDGKLKWRHPGFPSTGETVIEQKEPQNYLTFNKPIL